MIKTWSLALLFAFGVAFAPPIAEAGTSKKTQYSYDQVWRSAIRYLRVDARHDILEKDISTGYILFEMVENKTRYQGSIEIVDRTPKGGGHDIRLQVDLQKRPSYIESLVAEKILTKLRDEYGLPPLPPSKKESEKNPDDKKEVERGDSADKAKDADNSRSSSKGDSEEHDKAS